MVSTTKGVVYYSTIFLTTLIFLTEASAITTNYENSTTQNKTNEYVAASSQRTRLTTTRAREGSSFMNQNHERISPVVINMLKSNANVELIARHTPESELLIPSNSGGENNIKDKGGGNVDDDDQKTLSQQVAEGKYGLIQEEIFTIKPKRPGLISYDVNPEVPKDNINNLGGLEPDDIWLAENHLLVLAGGGLKGMQNQWTPIDNYMAPKRPVQLSPNPKVPPPFPVQLSENGPLEYLKPNDQPVYFPSYLNPLVNQYLNLNISQGFIPSLYGKVPYGGQLSIKSPLKPSQPINSKASLPPPVLVKPPPGSEFIPPYLGVGNQSEAIDEDDPSLYYPPPYDFYYPKDNTSRVPPGPLVPGIVLPPPPDFFSLSTNQTISKEKFKPITTKDKPFKPSTYKTGKQIHFPDGAGKHYPIINNHSSPNTFITFSDTINDVTYPDIHDGTVTYADVKVNKASNVELNEGWVPIPAPRPFYITGPIKPIKNTLLVMMETPGSRGYAYESPINTFNSPQKKPPMKLMQYINKSSNNFPPTTPLTAQLVSTQSLSQSDAFSSTTPSTPYVSPPTIKATYYFYEEPQFVDTERSKTPLYSTNPPSIPAKPIGEFEEHTSKTLINIGPNKGELDERKRKPLTPTIPIYYLAELQNIVDLVKPINLPYQQQIPKTQYYTTTAPPTYTIKKPSYERPTPKPILEYSYIASDYNNPPHPPTESTPPSSQYSSILQTSQPPQYHPVPHYPHDYSNYQQPHQYSSLPHYSVFNQAVFPYSKPGYTNNMPFLFLSDTDHGLAKFNQYDYKHPWMQQLNPYSHISYPTENPYYAFFTKEDADFIDENTKKYFSIFGQKLKHNVEATTPLSAETVAPSINKSQWSTTKYMYASYPSQSSTSVYDAYSSTTAPSYSESTSYNSISNNKPLSLEGDTQVNYITPLPTVDPEAEYVPFKISKHIRPIVVEDLPPDVNERLKNIMNLQNKRIPSNTRPNKYQYTLIDSNFDNTQYSNNFINSYSNDNRLTGKYSGQGTSTPISLENDIQVNYKQGAKLTTNSDAEYIENSSQYSQFDKDSDPESHTSKPLSLADDILVNYKGRYTTNQDAEYINSGSDDVGSPIHSQSSSRKNNNVISYAYPNVEHGHFYFLTPQETHLSQIEDERYDFQSDVEKPSSYFKRVPKQQDQSTQIPQKAT